MKKQRSIMIDMDEVIVSGGMLYLINKFLKTNYKEEDFKDFYMQNIVPEEKKNKFMKYFISNNMYDYGTLYKNVGEVIEKLNNKYKIYIGTSYIIPEIPKESGIILVHKFNYLMKNFPFLSPANFVFLVDKSVLNCDIKIDDRIDNLEGAKIKLLFTSYHNKDISDKELKTQNIIRVNSWLEIEGILLNEC